MSTTPVNPNPDSTIAPHTLESHHTTIEEQEQGTVIATVFFLTDEAATALARAQAVTTVASDGPRITVTTVLSPRKIAAPRARTTKATKKTKRR